MLTLQTLNDPDLEVEHLDDECVALHFLGVPIGFMAIANDQYIAGCFENQGIQLSRHATQAEAEAIFLDQIQ